MYAPMLLPLAGIVTGILCALMGAGWITALALIVVGIALYLTLLHKSRDIIKGFSIARWHHLWIYIIFAGIGVFSMDINRPFADDKAATNAVAFVGRVETISTLTSGDRATVAVSHIIGKDGQYIASPNCKALLNCKSLPATIDDAVLVASPLRPVERSSNSLLGGSYKWLLGQGIMYTCRADEEEVNVCGHTRTLRGICQGIREDMEAWIEKTSLQKSTQHFLITILLGDRRYLDPESRDLYKDAGLSHMLALSGMHVAIICGIIMWLLFPINFVGLYKYRILATSLIMLCYAFLTGLAPSTVRATIMLIAMAVSMYLERKNGAWNSLLLATFIILVASPLSLMDVGLQFSFICVASLIFFVRPLNPFSQHDHPLLFKMATAIITTMVATLTTWCLTAYYFGTVPTAFLLSNLIVLPLLPIYLTCAIIYFGLSAVGITAGWMTYAIDLFPKGLDWFVGKVSNGGTTALHFTPSLASVWIWLLAVVAIACVLHSHKKRLYGWVAGGLACCFVVTLAMPAEAEADNFMVRRGSQKIQVSYLQDGSEIVMELPRYCTSETMIKGKRILVVDSESVMPKGEDSAKAGGSGKRYDIVVLGGSGPKQIEELTAHYEIGQLIIHASTRRARESTIMHAADSLKIPAHSIRESGPYRAHF